jgi:hypothetical protein
MLIVIFFRLLMKIFLKTFWKFITIIDDLIDLLGEIGDLALLVIESGVYFGMDVLDDLYQFNRVL